MNMIKQLNAAIAYIERNLCEEIDTGEIARIACVSHDSFLRFFSYMTGMTLTGYIRRRRLTEAAYELQRGRERIIDIAAKYGYDSADSFTRAFVRQHGITPTEARRGGALTICSPVSFHIIIKGQFAAEAKKCGIPIRLQPAWLVSATDDNPYNRKTREILASFADMEISVNQGNVIFPEGNALKYLAEYFTDELPENPYKDDPCNVRCVSFSPNGDVLGENVYRNDIMEIIKDYAP